MSGQLKFSGSKMQRSMNYANLEDQRKELFQMTPSQLAQQALHDTGIDMAAINRIRTMGSR